MKKFILSISLLIFLTSFLIFSQCSEAADINSEEMENYLRLSELDTKRILMSLTQGLTNEWINSVTSPDSKIENQAIFVIIKRAFQVNVLTYAFFQLPKEIIKVIYKIALLINRPDKVYFLLDEFEKMSVEKAKEYALNWFFQKEIRVATGNLRIVYSSNGGGFQNITFPYIIVYQSLGFGRANVSLEVYSKYAIEPPVSSLRYPWEGIDKGNISPFVLRVNGIVEKASFGSYKWVSGPEIEVEFPEHVPEFDFSEPSLKDKIVETIKKKTGLPEEVFKIVEVLGNKMKTGSNLSEKDIGKDTKGGFGNSLIKKVKETGQSLFDKLKSIVSKYNPFPGALVLPKIELIKTLQKLPKNQSSEVFQSGPEFRSPTELEPDLEPSPKSKLQLSDIQVQIQEISKRIGAISQRTDELLSASMKKVSVEADELEEETERVEEEPEAEKEEQEEQEEQEQLSQSLSKILISEVCAGLDKAKNEFVELYNLNDFAVSLANENFSLELVSSGNKITKKKITWLKSNIPAKGYFLLVGGELRISGQMLVPDATFSSQLSSTSGVIIGDGESSILDKAAWAKVGRLPPASAVETQV